MVDGARMIAVILPYDPAVLRGTQPQAREPRTLVQLREYGRDGSRRRVRSGGSGVSLLAAVPEQAL